MAKTKLWNLNFFLLWQGQFVSSLGDVVYYIALGFWVLNLTGSTAVMGTLMAVSSLPRVLVSAFAGVIVDRSDRKWLLVFMDLIRGIAIVFVGVAAYLGFVKIVMVFIAGVIISLCGAFFNPAVSSILPDIVDKNKLVQANSVFSIIYTGTGIVGNPAGGILYKTLGAPFMFLFNGLSYLFSALTVILIRVPKIVHTKELPHFFQDMKIGFNFIWQVKGLRLLMMMACVLNLFAIIGIMLILPLFEQAKHLGPSLYGVLMGFFTGGMLLGYLFGSVANIPAERRFAIFIPCFIVNCLCLIFLPIYLNFSFIVVLAGLAGFTMALLNAFINSVIQMTTPQDMRGKVFGFLSSIVSGLNPVAFAVGGILAELISVRAVISSSFLVCLILFALLSTSDAFRRFINFDPDKPG